MTRQASNLYIIPTPIGNLEDITLRSIRILKEADLILAEDTRTSGQLLKHHQIEGRLKSYHVHNEHKIVEEVIDRMKSGDIIALISDAGTPSISDPGFLLIRETLKNGLQVECLPGATAFVPALVKSGLPSDRFIFEGFLPHKKGRKTRLQSLIEEKRTMIFYESPHRLLKFLAECAEVFGNDRQISVSRELTKMYEETFNGTVQDALAYFTTSGVKGEIVVVLAGKNENA
ncbi:MAG: 16S rRNA (cytidine(1402)-2'-O)-methyltransferase [Cyclobacteriaceae bacterium]|nr:16S rRNA (cytidine(1402)-2'-O)-methyltransferase [Cyclobacteriaceae bacterium]